MRFNKPIVPSRLYAHIGSIIFFALIRTNANPTLVQVALATLLFDEVLFHLIRQIRKDIRDRKVTQKKTKNAKSHNWYEEVM
jgi:hypothetical protein